MSLALNGTNQYLTIDDATSLHLGETFAFGGWIKVASNSGSSYQFLYNRFGSGTDYIQLILGESGVGANANLLWFYAADGGQSISVKSDNTVGQSTAWQHILIVGVNGVVTIYINGEANGTATNESLPAIQQSAVVYLGTRYDQDSVRFFNGRLADWAKWNSMPSESTRTALAGGVSAGNYDPVWWRKLLNNSTDGVGALSITEVNSPSFDAADHPVSYGVAAMALENQFVAPFVRSQFVR